MFDHAQHIWSFLLNTLIKEENGDVVITIVESNIFQNDNSIKFNIHNSTDVSDSRSNFSVFLLAANFNTNVA